MKQEISPQILAVIVGIVAVVILGIAYKLFFTHETVEPPRLPKNEQYKLHPTAGEAYHNPQGLGLQPQSGSAGQ